MLTTFLCILLSFFVILTKHQGEQFGFMITVGHVYITIFSRGFRMYGDGKYKSGSVKYWLSYRLVSAKWEYACEWMCFLSAGHVECGVTRWQWLRMGETCAFCHLSQVGECMMWDPQTQGFSLLPLCHPYSMLDQMARYDALENEMFYSAGWIWSLDNIGKVTEGWVCVECTFILFGP